MCCTTPRQYGRAVLPIAIATVTPCLAAPCFLDQQAQCPPSSDSVNDVLAVVSNGDDRSDADNGVYCEVFAGFPPIERITYLPVAARLMNAARSLTGDTGAARRSQASGSKAHCHSAIRVTSTWDVLSCSLIVGISLSIASITTSASATHCVRPSTESLHDFG